MQHIEFSCLCSCLVVLASVILFLLDNSVYILSCCIYGLLRLVRAKCYFSCQHSSSWIVVLVELLRVLDFILLTFECNYCFHRILYTALFYCTSSGSPYVNIKIIHIHIEIQYVHTITAYICSNHCNIIVHTVRHKPVVITGTVPLDVLCSEFRQGMKIVEQPRWNFCEAIVSYIDITNLCVVTEHVIRQRSNTNALKQKRQINLVL